MKWDADSVRRYLPDVVVKLPSGGYVTGRTVAGYDPAFAWVGHAWKGGRTIAVFRWTEIADALNADTPLVLS